jgi:pimeloyl-ACP methyl ester carboxylesterase
MKRKLWRYKMPVNNSIFKSPEFEKQYLELYETVLARWDVPAESLDIATRFGITHLNISGASGNQPLILLPGFGANSTMWFPNVAALTGKFRVYAIDTNGQPGKSIPNQKLTAANSADWIVEVLDGLDIEKAIMVGISLGGWLTLNFTIYKPARVTKIALLDPAASFEKISPTFLRHSFIPIMVHPTRTSLIKYFRWITQGYMVDPNWGELMIRGILNTRPQPPIRATTFTDSELRTVEVPVLLLIGERSVIYNPQRAYQRAVQLIPNLEAEIIPGASHALNAEKAEYVNARILEFCQL